jgi:hypothetical protein
MRPRWQPTGRRVSSFLLEISVEGFLLDERTIQAYRATDYRVHADEPFTLRIDEACVECDAFLEASQAATAAFITAWNPYSQLRSSAENARAQDELAAELAEESIAVLAGEGLGRIGDWPPEPSFFAWGISRDKAVNLAQKYQQNAFVWIERGKAAELVLTA